MSRAWAKEKKKGFVWKTMQVRMENKRCFPHKHASNFRDILLRYTAENFHGHGCQKSKKRARQTLFTLHHFYRTKTTVRKFLGPRKFS